MDQLPQKKASLDLLAQSGHLEAPSATAQSPCIASLSSLKRDATSGKAPLTTSATLPANSALPGGSSTLDTTSVRRPCGSHPCRWQSASDAGGSSAISIAGRCNSRRRGQLRAKCTRAASGPPRGGFGGSSSSSFQIPKPKYGQTRRWNASRAGKASATARRSASVHTMSK